jgi:hypothetical protein
MCLKNTSHVKHDTVCQDCLKTIDDPVFFPDLNKIEPELRALVTQLTIQERDMCKCWKSSYKHLKINGKKLKIENVYYAFFKGDIGNHTLKRICGTIGCVNPCHHVSRFETPLITNKTRAGLNKKLIPLEELSDTQWLRQP